MFSVHNLNCRGWSNLNGQILMLVFNEAIARKRTSHANRWARKSCKCSKRQEQFHFVWLYNKLKKRRIEQRILVYLNPVEKKNVKEEISQRKIQISSDPKYKSKGFLFFKKMLFCFLSLYSVK